jgi:hypothetical protein
MRINLRTFLAAAAIGLVLVPPAVAQDRAAPGRKAAARIAYVPANSHPPVPMGLKVTCLRGPNTLMSSKTCPVVKYQGITTWAYSFYDNRVALGLVSYDAQNNVVRNVTKNGARYVWVMTSSVRTKTATMSGQANKTITVPWTELGTP